MKKQNKELIPKNTGASKRKLGTLIILIVNTVLIFAVYQLAMDMGFIYIFWVYFAAAAVLSLIYLIYNRGLSRRNITIDMLPDDWDEAAKHEFIDDAGRRLKKSKWMLTLLFPFAITFGYEVISLYYFDYFKNLFSK